VVAFAKSCETGLSEYSRTLGGGKSNVPIRNAGGKAFILHLAEGAIDGANLRGVGFRVAFGLLLAWDQTARKHVPDTTFQSCWSSVADWQWILLRLSISAILL
jgi:hypothetical protein